MWAEIKILWNHAIRMGAVDGHSAKLSPIVVILKRRQMQEWENNSCNLIAMQYTAK